MSSSIRWVVFDAADTLLRPNPAVAEAYARTASKYGVTAEPTEIKKRFGPAIRKYFSNEVSSEELDRQRWQELVFDVLSTTDVRVFDDLWEHFALSSSWKLYEDVGPAIEDLVGSGFRIAIASNFDARLLSIVRDMPVLSVAEQVFISSQLGFRKPSSKFYAEIERRLDCSPKHLLMVGDSEHADFEGATNAGWNAVHLAREESAHNYPKISTLLSLSTILTERF